MSIVAKQIADGTNGSDLLTYEIGDIFSVDGIPGKDRIIRGAGNDELDGILLALGAWDGLTNNGSYYDGGEGFDRAYTRVFTHISDVAMVDVDVLATFLNFELLEYSFNWAEDVLGTVSVTGTDKAERIVAAFYSGDAHISLFGGDDYVEASHGNVTVDGGDGNDRIFGSHDGDSTIFGGNGNDVIYGGRNTNTLYGGAGDDIIWAAVGVRGGDNSIYGGDGNDTIQASADERADTFNGGSGKDTLALDAHSVWIDLSAGTTRNLGGDRLTSVESVEVWNYDSNDTIYGSEVGNVIAVGDGNDFVVGRGGNDTILAGRGTNRIFGGDGNDTIYGGDRIGDVGSSDNMFDGGVGNDKLITGLGTDRLYGRAGDDVLYGGAGTDHLYGDAGNDVIQGYYDADDMWGGTGRDTFLYTKPYETGQHSDHWSPLRFKDIDTIYDFSQKQGDTIDLSAISPYSYHYTFIGTKPFGGQLGEIRYVKTESDTYIYVREFEHRKTPFVIHLDDAIDLTKYDFIL